MDKAALALGGGSFVAGGVVGGVLAWYWEDWMLSTLKSKNRRVMFAVTTGVVAGIGSVYLLTRVGALTLT